MTNFMDLMNFVNVEADKLQDLQERYNDHVEDGLKFPNTHVSAETRAFAIRCIQAWIRRTSPKEQA